MHEFGHRRSDEEIASLVMLKVFRVPSLTSIVLCLIVLIVIVGPMVYLLATLAGEAKAALDFMTEKYQSGELANWELGNIPG